MPNHYNILICIVFLMTAYQTQAQNSYPASGDALIHGLTIGTGPGTAANTNTALGLSALLSNTGGAYNVAVGLNALANNTGGGYNNGTGNTAIGGVVGKGVQPH